MATLKTLSVTDSPAGGAAAAAGANDFVRKLEFDAAIASLSPTNHAAATVLDTLSIDFSLTGQQISAAVRRKTASLAVTEGAILETTDGLVVQLGTVAGTAAKGTDMAAANTAIAGKAAASHTHAIADVTGLQGALDAKAAASHSHAIADVTGLQGALDAKSATTHTHPDATTSVSGFLSAADKTKLDASSVVKYSAAIGDGTLTTIPVIHNLNTQNVIVSLRYESAPKTSVDFEWSVVDNNTISIGGFGSAPAAGSLRVVVM